MKKGISKITSLALVVIMSFVLLPTFTFSAYAGEESVYVNGEHGNDGNDGMSENEAVKTIAKAYELVEEGGTIIICGDTYFNKEGAMSTKAYVAPSKIVTFEGRNNAQLKKSNMLTFLQADTTFQNITLLNNNSGAKLIANGYTLTFGNGFDLHEQDQNGTGMQVIGGGYYGSHSGRSDGIPATSELSIVNGSNVIIEDGTFGSIYAGPDGNGDIKDDPIPQGTYRVSVSGTAKIKDLYAGADWEMSSIPVLTLPDFEIIVDGEDVEIGNIWGGGYFVAPISQAPQITQKSTTITVEDGSVHCIFGGSLGGLYAKGSRYTNADVIVNINGGAFDEIYAGGVILGTEGDESYSAIDVVESMKIVTSVDLRDVEIYSSGDTIDIGYGVPSANETVETGTLEIVLSGENAAIGTLETLEEENGEHTAKPAETLIITLDDGTFDIPNGFDELRLQNSATGTLSADMMFDKLSSDDVEGNTLFYKKDTQAFPVLTLEKAVDSLEPIVVNFDSEPAYGQTIVSFTDENNADVSKFALSGNIPGTNKVFSLKKDRGNVILADLTAPKVIDTTPTGNDIAISANTVSITFSKAMDTASKGTVTCSGDVTLTASSPLWSNNDTTATYIITSGNLAYGTTYTLYISGFMDLAGNVMADDNSKIFTTVNRPSGGGGGGGGSNINAPTINQKSGTMVKNSLIKLSTTYADGKIYYTTDGKNPTSSSLLYDKPIVIDRDMIIKAIVISGGRTSGIVTFTYTVRDAKISFKDKASETRYMKAHGDLFEPDGAITRYEMISALSHVLDIEKVDTDKTFHDVTGEYKDLITLFAGAGIIDGFSDSTFGGEKGLTRAEFVKIMSVVLGLDIKDSASKFDDMAEHWADKYVVEFEKLGYIKGYADNKFMPDNQMTRAEFVTILNRIIGVKSASVPSVFEDLPNKHWACDDIMAVYTK